MPLAQDHLTESQGERKGKLGGAEGIFAGRVETCNNYKSGKQGESTLKREARADQGEFVE